ncbi:MAG: DUF5606 domain-containing protein [Bacteroidales bacterium]|jgi:hypothetical protein|nr:DUF5606 domain-containing protein [Bacteroidales bacterium]
MDLSKILAISGKPGLYKMLSQTKSGFIVESLTDGKRFPVFAHERVSSLEEISVFTTKEDDLQLKDVFRRMFEKTEGKPAPDANSDSRVIRQFFQDTVAEHDPERVYISDMKKAIAWFNLLLEKEMLVFEPEGNEPLPEAEKEEEKTEVQK